MRTCNLISGQEPTRKQQLLLLSRHTEVHVAVQNDYNFTIPYFQHTQVDEVHPSLAHTPSAHKHTAQHIMVDGYLTAFRSRSGSLEKKAREKN